MSTALHASARSLPAGRLVARFVLWNNRAEMSAHSTSRVLIVGVLVGLGVLHAGPASSQTPSPGRPDAVQGEAYARFMSGLRLERERDVEGAIRAYRDAAALDPTSGEALAQLASLHYDRWIETYERDRNDELAAEAIRSANAALEREPANLTAHRVLGFVYAAQASTRGATPEHSSQAIEHFEQARATLVPDVEVEITLARLYLNTEQAEQAIEVLEPLLEDQLGLGQAGVMLSLAYEEVGRAEDALAVLEQVVGSGRPSSRVLRRLGELYGRNGRWREAIQAYEGAVARNPRSSRALRELANALLQAGELERGRDTLRQLTSARPNDGSALYRLSEVERQLGNLEEAATAARTLIEAEPNGIRGPFALAEVHSRRHDFRGVVDTLEPALQRARDGNLAGNQIASLLGRVGFAYEQLQDYDNAARVYEEATELAPTSLGFGARRVQAYLELGRIADAQRALDDVRSHHPGELALVRLEARILGDAGDVGAGVEVLRARLVENVSDPLTHVALATYYATYDRYADAVDVLTSADERFPNNVSILFQLGAAREQSDQFLEAERAFRRVLDHDPEHAATLNYLGYMLADRGDRLEESVGLLERAIELDPHNGAYLDSLGWAYFKLDRLDLAETHLRQASERMVWNSVIQDHLGDLLFRLGRYQEAIDAWETALAGDGAEVESAAIEGKMEDARRRIGR